MRSAMMSSAFHCSVYWSMNIACRLLNCGPVTFQWKLCVIMYSVKLSASSADKPSTILARSFSLMPMLMEALFDFLLMVLSPCRQMRLRKVRDRD